MLAKARRNEALRFCMPPPAAAVTTAPWNSERDYHDRETIAIVGLGAIGGRLSGALMDFDGAHVSGGSVRRQETAGFSPWPTAWFTRPPLTRWLPWPGRTTILCATPRGLWTCCGNTTPTSPGSLDDVCGVKTAVLEKACCCRRRWISMGSHPMAGTELVGIEYAPAGGVPGQHRIMVPGLRAPVSTKYSSAG